MDIQKIAAQLRAFFKEKRITQEEIAAVLGVSQPYVNALLKGRKAFGKRQAEKWGKEFGLSALWLLTGEGEMIKQPVRQMSNGDNNTQIAGDNNQINIPTAIDKVIDEIAEQRKLVAKSQEQIDRLLSLLERNRRHGQEQQEQQEQ